MSCDQSYPFPQVFVVDRGGGQQHPAQPPDLVPCWSFPPAQKRAKNRSYSYMGAVPGVSLVVLFLFLLVFAAMGVGAYQIYNMQKELRQMREVKHVQEFVAAEKQIGFQEPQLKDDVRAAAHVIGRIETKDVRETLRWEPRAGRAFTAGGVVYSHEDGALQVNETGLYHIYSRVELIFMHCSPKSSYMHSVFVRRAAHPSSPLILMKAHRPGVCAKHPGQPWTAESFLGSALQLQKDDKILVNVSHPQYLSHEHYVNFFGLYKI